MRFDVCVVGSANLDLVATVDRLPGPGETVPGTSFAEYPGGKGLNQAVAAARSGATVAFVGALGDDGAAATLRAVMADDGIDSAQVTTAAVATGRGLIGVSATGENSIIVVAGANGTVTATELPSARVVLTQLEVPLPAVERALSAGRAAGAVTVLNPAPVQPITASILQWCDIVVPNEHEVELLGGVAHLLDSGVGAVVVTMGSRGAELHTAEGVVHVQPFSVVPVDSTGAGDTFSGSLCARLAAGDDLPTALRFASAAGALCTTTAGAVPSIPRRAAVEALLSEG
ncbi:MAG: ribokinase [Ilumatobacteraceae bacterium]|nr:ribokinase [Ilumatobacteraceae bacterium]